MEGLSGTASAIAIVSLAVQLVDTVQEISKFLRNVKDAPTEVLRLLETLEQLQGTLDNVRQLIDHQFLVLRLPGSPVFITKAMECCERQIKALETLVWKLKRPLGHQHIVRRTWSSMKIVAKKQDIEDIQCRLRDAKMDLQFAVSSNSWQLQMYHIQNTVPVVHQIRQAQYASIRHAALDQKEDKVSSKYEVSSLHSSNLTGSPPYTEQEHLLWYRGMFGTVTLKKTSKYYQALNAGADGDMPLVNQTVWAFRPSFINYTLQLLYARSFGYVSRSLNVYPVLSESDPIFSLCEHGDLLDLQTALSRQRVSPFVTDHESGWTLLHHAAVFCQSEICIWLLQIGLDADATDHNGLKALAYVGNYGLQETYSFKNKTVDTSRTLAQYQDDISAFDLDSATIMYDGPPEAVDILLAHSSSQFERFDIAESVGTVPPLAVALLCYSRTFFNESSPEFDRHSRLPQATCLPGRKQWEPLIKRFIHKSADLHVPVPRGNYSLCSCPLQISENGTPLDVLFQGSETPDEAKTLGADWSRLLASQGHDVVAYLKKEMTLHQPEHQMTYPAYHMSYKVPFTLRILQFTFDDAGPRVWWEWWIDPASNIDLLECEFKQMVKYICLGPSLWIGSLVDTWPFQYPVWYDNPEKVAQDWLEQGMEPAERRRRAHLAMQRANRRLEKRYAKNAYSKDLQHPQMPGAWPASSWE